MSKPIILIFSGFNERAVVSFIRTLEKNKLDYIVVAKSFDDFIFFTTYKNKVIAIRDDLSLDLDVIKKYICLVRQKVKTTHIFIAPSTEALNRFLLKERSRLEAMKVIVPLTKKSLYDIISDKYSFGVVCKENGISIPKEFYTIENIDYPFVAKPKKYFSKGGKTFSPQLIFNESEKVYFVENYPIDDFYFQEFIEGDSHYLLYYFSRNKVIYKFSQKNIVQQSGGKSIVAATSSDFHFSDESKKYEALFLSLNFRGLVMVEVKQKEFKNYMIEANPRFWGPSQLFVDANANLFESFLFDYQFLDKAPTFNNIAKNKKYFWHGGFIKSINELNSLVYYSDKRFSITDWLDSDVYKREDALEYYKKEVGG
ncbi:ATP-grasp domain-containing protein [Aestuariivivens sp. NBU2969]|uniref:ATP-grasp domain-containing protein n=1 Tax=Aestuariivivens sp. NBU2969 TaxID=2873267 RepID=UPI001CBB5FB7|nr:ATP-grasp domain-containing protein [Aestuariivivens sp. NBU2969]